MARKKRLTKKDLRDLGASPGMLVRRIDPAGKQKVRQITPDLGRGKKKGPPAQRD